MQLVDPNQHHDRGEPFRPKAYPPSPLQHWHVPRDDALLLIFAFAFERESGLPPSRDWTRINAPGFCGIGANRCLRARQRLLARGAIKRLKRHNQ